MRHGREGSALSPSFTNSSQHLVHAWWLGGAGRHAFLIFLSIRCALCRSLSRTALSSGRLAVGSASAAIRFFRWSREVRKPCGARAGRSTPIATGAHHDADDVADRSPRRVGVDRLRHLLRRDVHEPDIVRRRVRQRRITLVQRECPLAALSEGLGAALVTSLTTHDYEELVGFFETIEGDPRQRVTVGDGSDGCRRKQPRSAPGAAWYKGA